MKSLMSVNISLLCAVVCVLSGVITNRATEGGNAHIQCPYDRGYETYQKYLSKGIYRDSVVVIQTQKQRHPAWTHQGRYSLYDDTERRVFTVTITNLIQEDSDTYWCGVNTWGHDEPTEVRLTVDRAPVPPKPDPVTSRPLLSTTHPSTNITTGDVMFSGVVLGVVLLLLGLLLFMFFRQRRDRDRRPTANQETGTIATTDTACDFTSIFATATNPCTNVIYSKVGPFAEVLDSVTYTTVNFPRDPACLQYATVNFTRDPA
ncbi:CMRF35-like molecule 1, partial [Salvelinus namaycush]|uniref:CMRF35-like molecule 1 n=1 Tax=Salvelinus namaycush TaxID=8040 RepID=A0A8U0U4D2_SALNM